MRRILITGAAGFIGFHLARYFAARGDQVWGLDNFNTYYDPALKHSRSAVLADAGIVLQTGDICDTSGLCALIAAHAITDIVHMAAQAGVRYSVDCPQAYVKANLEGFVSVLEACRLHPHIKLTYASSSSVYGIDSGTSATTIEARADRPTSLYGATKRSNELMAHAYHHLFGIRSTGLRYFTVYGPWGRPDMAYYLFAHAMCAGKPISLSAGGTVQRSFSYIDDIVAGTAAAVDYAGDYEIFNLGHPSPQPLSSIVDLLEQYLGVTAIRHHQPLPAGDVVATCADIAHSQACLGFSPQIDLVEGLARFAQWYRSFYKQ
jgi:UDP-glucuronate 4-epimerase